MNRLRFLTLALAIATLPFAATADEAFVDWHATSGPLPPEYAWSVKITISGAGQLMLKYCDGYATEGKACSIHRAKVAKRKLDAIRSAVTKADLVKRPMTEMQNKPIGGSTVAATVRLGGTTIAVSGFPQEADSDRVGSVLRAIYQAVPESLALQFLEGD